MFVLDTAGVDGRDCLSDFAVLLRELEACAASAAPAARKCL
jgi:hypothetical protein